MKQGKKLLILPAVAVLLGMGTGCSGNSENKAQDMAIKALMASVDNPESVKIVGISKSDSVFGREYVTMKEKMALSVAMMEKSEYAVTANALKNKSDIPILLLLACTGYQ